MPHTQATRARVDQVDAVAKLIRDEYDTEDRIYEAQMTMQFDEGIKVANEVMAEFIADMHLLLDFHGQDFDRLLLDAQAKYDSYQEASNA